MRRNRFQITRLESKDVAEICADMMANSEPWISLKRGYKECLELITDPTLEVYVAWLDKRVIGSIVIEMLGTFKGYIKSVYVLPEMRDQGIGTELIKFAEERIFSETPNVFLLVSSFNHKAQELYEKLGYVKVGELSNFVVKGYSEILMRKTLGPLSG
jgi:ribosomal-protein-alanine N-acetyltransferase